MSSYSEALEALIEDIEAIGTDLEDPMAHREGDDGTDCLACQIRDRLGNAVDHARKTGLAIEGEIEQ